jgi:two-component system sensor histidine kinase HydH
MAETTATAPAPAAGRAPVPEGPAVPESRDIREQYAEIAQVVGGLAHEIRNPLSTIRLNLDLLAEDLRGAESPREHRMLQKIERVRKESHRLEDLLEDVLRFVRLNELRLESTDLNAVVEELADFFEPQAASQGIVIRRHLADGLPPAELDVDLFKQALFNLIRNAELAMPTGGELILATRRDNDALLLEVTDTGCGISPELLTRVFDPFYSTRPGGTGLGLPTARRIVEAHGGTIRVTSEPGKGSVFTLRLPCGPRPVSGSDD